MKTATLVLDRDFAVGLVDPRLYGSFVEHLGRCVYGGIYEPGHVAADANGFRRDVIQLVKELGITVTRYPGGNFVSGFNWEDGIGKDRPTRLDLAWMTTETNAVGIAEFVKWAQAAETQVMYAVNLGTRGPDAARNLVEYANHEKGTAWSDLRIQNGDVKPFDIKLWCLGNEMDGPWQMNALTAGEYGRKANEAAKMMKWVDPAIEVVACGSSHFRMPTFGTWEYQMLMECYENIDHVSLHRYYNNQSGDSEDFLAQSMDMDEFIKTVVSICDTVKGTKHQSKRLTLSFDEWNVWYHAMEADKEIFKNNRWGQALPLLEDVYNLEDALLVGLLLITFLKNADRVKIACMAQLVNVIAPIMTRTGGGAWAQTIFYPFMEIAKYGRGTALRPVLTSPMHDTKQYSDVPDVDATATVDDQGNVTIFAVNRSLTDNIALSLDVRAFQGFTKCTHRVLTHADLKAVNTELAPKNVYPVDLPEQKVEDGKLTITLPKQSFNTVRLG